MNKRLNATINIGGALLPSLGRTVGSAQRGLSSIGSSVRTLTMQQRTLGDAIRRLGQDGMHIDGLRTRYASVTAELTRQRAVLVRINDLEGQRSALATRRGEVGSALRGQVGAAVGIGAAMVAPIRSAMKFETAMLGVAKQVDGARDASGKLTPVYHQMAREIQQLGRTIPVATNELAEMVTAGARMGVAREHLIDFTRTAATMAEAFELPSAQLADDMGKIAGLYKVPIPAIGALADSINYLDDNSIAKAGDIIDFLTRTGGVAGAVKVGATQMAALGSTLLTLGERAETAGTATNAMFQKLAAADKGTKKFKAAMAEIGLSTAAVQKGMQTDAQGTLLGVLDRIAAMPAEKRLGVAVELVGMEHSDTLAKLVSGRDTYRAQIELSTSNAAAGSMQREMDARLATTEAQFKLVANAAGRLGVSIGGMLLSIAGPGGLPPVIDRLTTFVDTNREAIGTVVKLGVGLLGAKIAFSAISYSVLAARGAIVGAKLGMVGMTLAAGRMAPALRLAGTAALFVGRALLANPIGLAVTAIAAGAGLIYANWSTIAPFFGTLWGGVKAAFSGGVPGVLAALGPLGAAVGITMAAWRPLTGFFTGLWGGVKSIIGSAVEWISVKLGSVIALADRMKAGALFGGAAAAPPGKDGAPGRAGLPEPAMAASRGTVTSTSTVDVGGITIMQQPGQDARALAREVAKEISHQQGIRQRSSMHDGAGR